MRRDGRFIRAAANRKGSRRARQSAVRLGELERWPRRTGIEPVARVRQPDAATHCGAHGAEPGAVVAYLEPAVASASRRARSRRVRHPACGETPCLIAFSTSGCRIRFGTRRRACRDRRRIATVSRSWNRVCSISRYFCRNSSSSCSGDLCAPCGPASGAAGRSGG